LGFSIYTMGDLSKGQSFLLEAVMEYLYNFGWGSLSYAKSRPVIALEIRLTLSRVPLSFYASPMLSSVRMCVWVVVSHETTGVDCLSVRLLEGGGETHFSH
jgi:hypothetical protein